MGIQMAGVMLLFAFAGIKLDQYFSIKNNLLTAILTVLGVAVALYLVIKDLSKMK